MNRYICIHGHFYQPPRENPWLEEVELQESAYPYHDWNEKITAESYAPNTASRILDENKRIINIVNNYAHISFNFGPTLLSWMEKHWTQVYQDILKADKESQKIFSGHGSALAQVYNHMIMPLANSRDERTQVYWGIKDFEHRFKRKPEGMWLAETAVNTETLEILAEYGIKFTILAPHQAARVRKIGDEKWRELQNGDIDPQRAYLCRLPSGKEINLFFYDGPISRELAFQNLLKNGERFAHRLMSVFPFDQRESRLVNITSDGETYGHHQNFGDMALSFCLHHIESYQQGKVTIYGEFLEKFPPTHEVQIVEDTSWSCVHGIERWKSDCGCHSGMHPGWHQRWREPLRNALDWLRDASAPVYEEHMKEFTDNPWKIRDEYIDVMLDRSKKNVDAFFKKHLNKEVNAQERIKLLKLLELQRHAMLMYTSCGWFFDEISGLETTQVLQYAARVIQLAKETVGQDFEDNFKTILSQAPSNIDDIANGAEVYERFVKPATIDLLRVGAHYAVSSLFEEFGEEKKVFCYTITSQHFDRKEAGRHRMAIGRSRIRSDITGEEEDFSFTVLHLGDHNLNGGVRLHMGDESFKTMSQEIDKAFSKSDITEIVQLMSKHFGMNNYSVKHLFKDKQKEVFDQIMASALDDLNTHFRNIYEHYYPLMQAREDLQIHLPKELVTSVEFALNRELIDVLNQEKLDVKRLGRIVDEIGRWKFPIDRKTLNFVATQRMNTLMRQLRKKPAHIKTLSAIEGLLRILAPFSLDLDLWKAQNNYFAINKEFLGEPEANKEKLNSLTPRWHELFKSLGGYLQVKSD